MLTRTAINRHPFLFVYGTLMRGFRQDLKRKVRARFLGEGTIRGTLYDLGAYPGATLAKGGSETLIKGEVYRLEDVDRATRILDEYEKCFPSQPHKSLFVRQLVTVTLAGHPSEPSRQVRSARSIHDSVPEGGIRRRAWTYFYNRSIDDARLIPSGNYRDCVASRRWS
jgi:gamma-glutamylcyclotransferase (GGCT)/AIG2-like uncharacterized protein YtfP